MRPFVNSRSQRSKQIAADCHPHSAENPMRCSHNRRRGNCLTSRAQARGADDVVRESGTGDAIPRCLQRFVRHHLSALPLLVFFFVPGRMPREPRLNATSGLPIEITAQTIATPTGMIGKFQPSILQSIGRHIEPTITVAIKKTTAHKSMNMTLFINAP